MLHLIPHWPLLQTGMPFAGVGQTTLQPPQLVTLLVTLVSHPATLGLQSAKPVLQV